MKIVFVCTGNTCRSPMAEKIATQLAPKHWDITSCGVYAIPGQTASEHALSTLRKNNLDTIHQSKQLVREELQSADYIFTMTENHRRSITTYFPEVENVTYALGNWPEQTGNVDISDPYGGDIYEYEATFDQLKHIITAIIEQLIVEENMEEQK